MFLTCISKTFGGLTHSFAATGVEDLAETRHHQLKTSITRNFLSKSKEILTANASWNGYKLCKFYDNRARGTPLQGISIPHFDQISVKQFPFWGSYTLTDAPMGVKFGVEEGTYRPLFQAKFHAHRCNVLPLQGKKKLKISLWVN